MRLYRTIRRPEQNEYPSYSQPYFDLVKTEEDILTELHSNFFKIRKLITSLPEEKLYYRYAVNKWTIKEILVHNIDDERIFTYRTLRYARNDQTPLHGFDEKNYAGYSNANQRSLENIFEEYWSVRQSTLLLFQNLPEEALSRRGSIIEGNDDKKIERTVRAMVYHIAGHELHHIKVIKERYLGMEAGSFVV